MNNYVIRLALWISLAASPALADPCKAIPDRGPMPAYLAKGKTFSGPVTYVGDADSLCVAVGKGPENLVEVRVADFYGPELNAPGGRAAKATLERVAKGRHAICTAGRRSYDRVVATCRIGGVSIGDLMRGTGVQEGGNGRWPSTPKRIDMPRPKPTTVDPMERFIGEAFRARRIAMGVSQNALAKALGVSFQQVQKYEQGQNRIATSRLSHIAVALDCKITDLIPEECR